jgi:hypothetical protein
MADDHRSRKEWSPAEEFALLEAIQMYGTKWTLLSKVLPGRCENSLKNKFHTLEKKAAIARSERAKVTSLHEAFVAPGLSAEKAQGWITDLLLEKRRELAVEGTTLATEAKMGPYLLSEAPNEELKLGGGLMKAQVSWLDNPSVAEAGPDVDVEVHPGVQLHVDPKTRLPAQPADDADPSSFDVKRLSSMVSSLLMASSDSEELNMNYGEVRRFADYEQL